MKRFIPCLTLGIAFAICGPARAVHLDVWVHADAVNRLDSGYFDVNADVPITTMDRALGWDFQEFDEDPYYANNPGYFAEAVGNAGYSNLPASSLVGFNVLSDLLYWNGTGPVSFSPVPAGETISVSLGNSGPVVIGTGTGAQPGFTLGAIGSGTANGFLHIHVNSVIAAGPNETVPADGIYIYQEFLTTNAPGFTNSLPFWVVMNNNISEDQRSEAINFLYPNQWCGPLGGSYNTDANWSGTIVVPELPGSQPVPIPQSPNGVDAVANFLDNLYADSTITLDSPATVGTINFKSVPRYTLAGPSALTLQSSTTAQINISLGNHTISAPLVIASNTIVNAGTNSLDFQGAQTWNDNTSLSVQSGTLNYAIPSGSTSSVGMNVSLSAAPGATVNVGGAVNPFSDGVHKVAIANGGNLAVNASGIVTGAVTGTGTTTVAAGAQLTADSIIQAALVIGGTSTSPSTVTIDPSDALGNPLSENGALPLSGIPSGLANDPTEVNGVAVSLIGGTSALPSGESRAVPEPSSLGLALAGLIACVLLPRQRIRRMANKSFATSKRFDSRFYFAGRRLPMMSRIRIRSVTASAFVTSLLGVVVLSCRPAVAQNPHPDFAPRVQNGQVVTGGLDDTNNAYTPNLRVFDFAFGEDDPTQPYFDADPGFRVEPTAGDPSPGFTPGKNLHFDILSGTRSACLRR